jgi:hypothetical protein
MAAMKQLFCLLVLSSMMVGSDAAAADTSGAILRCDPATVIKDIDGAWKSYYNAGHMAGFKECAIPLSPGKHAIKVCYDASIGTGAPISLEAVCGHDLELTLDAQAGHTYRVKLGLARDWKAWIEDVTESEAGLSYDEPPAKPKPTGPKKDRETTLIMRATPTYAMMGLQKGVIRGKWFTVGRLGGVKLLHVSNAGVPDGFHVYKAYAGDTVAFTWAGMMTGSIFSRRGTGPCGDFPVRVYEDLPAGKVLYLGDLTFAEAPGGFTGAYSDDLAGARAYLESHYPDLAGRLEAAPFREALTTSICYHDGHDLLVPR